MSLGRLLAHPRRLARWIRSARSRRGLVLMYHRVADDSPDPWGLCVSPAHFAEHLEVLRRFGHALGLAALTAGAANSRLPARATVVTFDDGYVDNLFHARPLLERHDVPATVFVATGYTGSDREFWWDELERVLLSPGPLPPRLELEVGGVQHAWDLGDAAAYDHAAATRDRRWRWREPPPSVRHATFLDLYRLLQPLAHAVRQRHLDDVLAWASMSRAGRASRRPMTAEELRALADGGLVEVGAHTVTHPRLSASGPDIQRDEIGRSKKHLEEMVGGPVTSFAYPFGGPEHYSAETVRFVKEAGFARACSTWPGLVDRGSDMFQLPRIAVHDWDGVGFEARLHAAFSAG